MFYEFKNPMPVITPLGDAYAIYTRDGSTFENDIWTVVMIDGGKILHFRVDQLRMYENLTFDISKIKEKTENEMIKNNFDGF